MHLQLLQMQWVERILTMPNEIPIEELPEQPLPPMDGVSDDKEWHNYVQSVEERLDDLYNATNKQAVDIMELEILVARYEFYLDLIGYAILGALVAWSVSMLVSFILGDKD